MKTILLVDDDDFILDHLVRLIRRLNFEVITAANGQDGVSQYKRVKPDCVLLDGQLPDMDGIEVFKQIKELDAKVCVYFLSGSGEIRESVMKMGAKGFLPKPVEIGKLCEALESI